MAKLPSWMRFLFIFGALPMLSSCGEGQHVMRYGVENVATPQRPVWPPPPEVARYEYAGQLTGWQNFPLADSKDKKQAEKVLLWIVGLDATSWLGKGPPKQGLQRPQAGVVDPEGIVYITDTGQKAVLVFNEPAGTLLTWRRARSKTTFESPVGIAIGPDRQILVADAELGCVIRLDHDGTPLGEFGRGKMQRPTGLARDSEAKLIFVADTRAHDIKIFNDDGALVKVIGGPGTTDGKFNAPTHLAFAKNRLYVTDTLNARVQVFDGQGEFLFSFGNRGINIGNMVRPKGVTVDQEGNIYVVESFHDHLLIYNSQGDFLLPIGGTGQEIGNFYLPSGIWTDGHERIFVSDMFNGRVVIFRFLGGKK